MKITESNLRQIIKEELENTLNESNTQAAATIALRVLNTITRQRGHRAQASRLMGMVFNQLGGNEAQNALFDIIDAQGPTFLEKGKQ
jgi:hypothetical protein|tara:strand:+ start:28480 stop:28740 length:261 start_codon:yes stop_codon:yes gene_type:complete